MQACSLLFKLNATLLGRGFIFIFLNKKKIFVHNVRLLQDGWGTFQPSEMKSP